MDKRKSYLGLLSILPLAALSISSTLPNVQAQDDSSSASSIAESSSTSGDVSSSESASDDSDKSPTTLEITAGMLNSLSGSYSAETTFYQYNTPVLFSFPSGYIKYANIIDTQVYGDAIHFEDYASSYGVFSSMDEAYEDETVVPNKDTLLPSTTYVSKSLDWSVQPSVYLESLSLDNEVTYTPVSATGSTYLSWEDAGYYNPFEYLDPSDLLTGYDNGDGTYEYPLNLGDLDSYLVASAFSSQLSLSSVPITYCALITDGNEITGVKIKGFEISNEGTIFEGTSFFEADAVITGRDLEEDDSLFVTPQASKGNRELAEAFESLAQDDFTLTQTESYLEGEMVYEAEPDSYVLEAFDSAEDSEPTSVVAYYKDGFDVQGAIRLGDGSFYKTPNYYFEQDFSSGYPSFDLSADVFDYDADSDTYSLSASASGSSTAFALFESSYTVSGSALKVKLSKDDDGNVTGIEFYQDVDYDNGIYDSFSATFSDIGSTDNGFDPSAVKDNVDGVAWSVLSPNGNNEAKTLLNVDLDTVDVPTTGGEYSIWTTSYYAPASADEGSPYVILETDVSEDLTNDQANTVWGKVRDLVATLEDNGYVADETATPDYYGFVPLHKTVTGVDGSDVELEVTPSFNWYYSQYGIAFEFSIYSASD